jgi:mono/diheme cytochrome c family protein
VRRAPLTLIAAAAATTIGCEGVFPQIDWQQMIDQNKYLPYAPSDHFADGRAMRPPPAGSVAHDQLIGEAALTDGEVDKRYLEQVPVAMTLDLLAQGRERFSVFCAACHGQEGDGRSQVAHDMELRAPPSLLSEEVRAMPPGRIFAIVSNGYGLMPAYATHLAVRERWAVVAYLGALQLSREVRLDELPADERREAERALKEAP